MMMMMTRALSVTTRCWTAAPAQANSLTLSTALLTVCLPCPAVLKLSRKTWMKTRLSSVKITLQTLLLYTAYLILKKIACAFAVLHHLRPTYCFTRIKITRVQRSVTSCTENRNIMQIVLVCHPLLAPSLLQGRGP